MVVQHNLPAVNANRQYGINNNKLAKNLEKLSSGYRINRASDDAAGLAISEKMRGQISGLDQATRNAQDGISLIQTAEGALQETHSILQRMRELAVQSANGTYKNEVDRENIQKEVDALKSEIDRISTSTHYNGIQLLDGSQSTNKSNGVDEVVDVTNVPKSNKAVGSTVSYATVQDGPAAIKTAQPKQDAIIANATASTGVTFTAGGGTFKFEVAVAGTTDRTSITGSGLGTVGDANAANTATTKLVNSLVDSGATFTIDDMNVKFTTNATEAGVDGNTLTVDISALKTGQFATDAAGTATKFNKNLTTAITNAISSNKDKLAFTAAADATDANGTTLVIQSKATGNAPIANLTAGFTKQTDASISIDFDNHTTNTKEIVNGDTVTIDGKTYEFLDAGNNVSDSSYIGVSVGNPAAGTAKNLADATGAEIANALVNAVNGQYDGGTNANGIKIEADATNTDVVKITANKGLIADGSVAATGDFANKGDTYVETTIDFSPADVDNGATLKVGGKDVTLTGITDGTGLAGAINTAIGGGSTAATADENVVTIKGSATATYNAEFTGKSIPAKKLLDIDSAKLNTGDKLTLTSGGNTYELEIGKDIKVGATNTQIASKIVDLASAKGDTTTALGVKMDASGKIEVGNEMKMEYTINPDRDIKGGITFQIGANGSADQRVTLNIDDMGSANIGTYSDTYDDLGNVTGEKELTASIADISVSTREFANDAIQVIDDAINQVSGTRADLGALQNRMEHTINSLGVASENLTSAESRIRDLDMAKEMMDFTKNQIISQASQSMLAQANSLPQGVLQLLQ